jgi:hypothetical protein
LLNGQSQKESERDQDQWEESGVPGNVSSPLVTQISSVGSSGVDSGQQGDSRSEKRESLVSIRTRSEWDGSEVEVLVSGESSVSKVGGLSLGGAIVFNISTNSSESVLRKDGLVSIESSLVVNSVCLDHSDGEDNDRGEDDQPGQESSDDHASSSSFHGSSVLVGSEVEQVDKDQPGQPSNEHKDESCGVDPLERRVVLVDLSSSDARSINETVGSIKQSVVGEESWVRSIETILAGVEGIVASVPPRSTHCYNVEECRRVSENECKPCF